MTFGTCDIWGLTMVDGSIQVQNNYEMVLSLEMMKFVGWGHKFIEEQWKIVLVILFYGFQILGKYLQKKPERLCMQLIEQLYI